MKHVSPTVAVVIAAIIGGIETAEALTPIPLWLATVLQVLTAIYGVLAIGVKRNAQGTNQDVLDSSGYTGGSDTL